MGNRVEAKRPVRKEVIFVSRWETAVGWDRLRKWNTLGSRRNRAEVHVLMLSTSLVSNMASCQAEQPCWWEQGAVHQTSGADPASFQVGGLMATPNASSAEQVSGWPRSSSSEPCSWGQRKNLTCSCGPKLPVTAVIDGRPLSWLGGNQMTMNISRMERLPLEWVCEYKTVKRTQKKISQTLVKWFYLQHPMSCRPERAAFKYLQWLLVYYTVFCLACGKYYKDEFHGCCWWLNSIINFKLNMTHCYFL